jgi:serine phosphatase RsbU (regulator of sigma subunit)
VALIGDVTGKGATAAAVTAVVRHTIRAAAHLTRWPRWMLERANTALLEQPDWDGLCTALCVRLTRGPRGLIARGASAGHLPPLTLRADGAVQSIERPGLMLGVLPSLDLQEWAVELRQGDSLILYTDGVTEARREGRLFGEDRLRALVQSCAGLPPTELVTRVERAVLEFQQYEPADDFAVLVLRIAEGYSTAPHR